MSEFDPDSEFSFASVIPRNRTLYTATDHLLKRVRMQGRFITESLVRDLIETADIVGNRPGKGGWVFEKEYDGVRMRLICDIGTDLEPRIVTGVSDIVRRDVALRSTRWSKETVHQVELRSTLSGDSNHAPPELMIDIECAVPIDVKSHRIVTEKSWDHVTCIDCGIETASKAELSSSHCSHGH
jgi:hypothetical protein